MSDREGERWTPTTQDIREAYYSYPGMRDWEAARAAAFDRWLAQHDAEVLAAAKPTRGPRCGDPHGGQTQRHTPIVCDRIKGHPGSHSYSGRWFWGSRDRLPNE